MEARGKIFVVSTPIGNLKDITLRALDVLKTADVIACEDTRETRKLLSHYEIKTPVTSFHDHTSSGKMSGLLEQVRGGKTVALVSDAGTPLLSDPGFPLVRDAVEMGIPVEPVPGPSALLAALAASGLPCEKFTFEGFLPQKEVGRRKKLEALKEEERTMVFYESPYRAAKALKDMADIFGPRPACVAREITKKFEEFIRGPLPDVAADVAKRKILGEIVIIVQGLRYEKKRDAGHEDEIE